MVADAKANLADAVKAGKITQAERQAMQADLEGADHRARQRRAPGVPIPTRAGPGNGSAHRAVEPRRGRVDELPATPATARTPLAGGRASAGRIIGRVIVDCAVYEDGRRREGELALEDAFEAAHENRGFVWLGLLEPSEQEFEAVRREFDLHELAVEDAIEAHQRPKLEVYGDTLLVVLKTARWIDDTEQVEFGEILVFVGDQFIITVRHGETALHDVRLELEQPP